MTRRRLLRGLAAGGALSALGIGGYAWRIEPVWPELVEREMPIPGLADGLAGFRIIHLSDLHVGSGVPMSYLSKSLDTINRREPDLVVVTGDLVQNGRSEWEGPAARLLAGLRTGEGVLVVLGNHDWGTCSMGGGLASFADGVAAAMVGQGVRVLRNQSVTIRRGSARLQVVGIDDYWGDRYDPYAAFKDVSPEVPCVALVHNPDVFLDLLESPAAWTLAGHTHGGQVNIPLVGPPKLPVRHKQFVAGRYQIEGKNLYVNRGLGWLKRIRFNARPEITEFTLRRA